MSTELVFVPLLENELSLVTRALLGNGTRPAGKSLLRLTSVGSGSLDEVVASLLGVLSLELLVGVSDEPLLVDVDAPPLDELDSFGATTALIIVLPLAVDTPTYAVFLPSELSATQYELPLAVPFAVDAQEEPLLKASL